MKKSTLLLFWALCCGISAAVAQDLIVKTDSTRIEARVTEVSPETVRYKRFSNPDGPTYVLPVAGIDYIRYANGETDRFRQPAAPAPAPDAPVAGAPAAPAPAPDAPVAAPAPASATASAPAASAPAAPAALPVQYELKRYAVGTITISTA